MLLSATNTPNFRTNSQKRYQSTYFRYLKVLKYKNSLSFNKAKLYRQPNSIILLCSINISVTLKQRRDFCCLLLSNAYSIVIKVYKLLQPSNVKLHSSSNFILQQSDLQFWYLNVTDSPRFGRKLFPTGNSEPYRYIHIGSTATISALNSTFLKISDHLDHTYCSCTFRLWVIAPEFKVRPHIKFILGHKSNSCLLSEGTTEFSYITLDQSRESRWTRKLCFSSQHGISTLWIQIYVQTHRLPTSSTLKFASFNINITLPSGNDSVLCSKTMYSAIFYAKGNNTTTFSIFHK